MEVKIRQYYSLERAVLAPKGKKEIIKEVCESEEVIHQWQLLAEDEEDLKVVDELYEMNVSEFVTVQGFFFASSIYVLISLNFILQHKPKRQKY